MGFENVLPPSVVDATADAQLLESCCTTRPYPSRGLRKATWAMPSLGAGTVVEVVGGTVVLGVGGTEVVGATPRTDCPDEDVETEAIPAPVARRRRVMTTTHELVLPGLRIPPLADPVILTHAGGGGVVGNDSIIPNRFGRFQGIDSRF